jgi:hypothetical protein
LAKSFLLKITFSQKKNPVQSFEQVFFVIIWSICYCWKNKAYVFL